MTLFFSLCCFSICFTPSLMLFKRVVMSDPLRIILFVLGSFFWLLSLLATSLVWLIANEILLIPVFFSILFQETARAVYYFLLFKAQGGLAKLANDGVDLSGVRLMYSSRHVLAIVCGLGMGVMAALILVTNILADYSDDGIVGMPAAIHKGIDILDVTEAYFPIYYSISCSLLTISNVVWTIIVWDGLHRFFHKLDGRWYISILITLFFHQINTTLSIWLRFHPIIILLFQLMTFAISAIYAGFLIKNASPIDVLIHLRRQRNVDNTQTNNTAESVQHDNEQ